MDVKNDNLEEKNFKIKRKTFLHAQMSGKFSQ
jgi:hypothetical protein